MKPSGRNCTWTLRDRSLRLSTERPLLMGIVNVTPDSFSDGGRFWQPGPAIDHALRLLDEGADIVDIGGESTRPGARPVPAEEELARVLPVVEGVLRARPDAIVSVDTSKGYVARETLAAGAAVINDVRGGADPTLLRVAAQTGAGLILMHMRGTPTTMQALATYGNVVEEVLNELRARLKVALHAGAAPEQVAIDPGIGFAKKFRHNWELLRHLDRFHELERPICVGLSRKGFLGEIVATEPAERDALTAGVMAGCWYRGYHIARVHDVRTTGHVLAAVRHLELGA